MWVFLGPQELSMMESMKYTVVAVLKKVLGQLSSQAPDDKK
jgi:hypothetical protein